MRSEGALVTELFSSGGRASAALRREPRVPSGLSLRLRAADGEQRRSPLGESPLVLGSDPGCGVVLDEPRVSPRHCRVEETADGRAVVRDLDSAAGTFVDGVRVVDAELAAGCTLQLGDALVRVDGAAPAALPALPGVLARDPALRAALELLRRAAPSQMPVLILGESGSGKEVAARAVHDLSPRAKKPFVPLNCGAISPELAEAELFGHERGAFTGAVTSAPGAFGSADGGTLFLDEIGDLPLHLQVKLLRALESGEVKPVGAARARQSDVRIVSATHRDLRACVRAGTFREDLYYRLRGATVELAPLRRRPLDVLPLAEHFLAQQPDGPRRGFAADARAALLAHSWPGNVRELKHVVHLAAVLSDAPNIRASALRFDGAPEPEWDERPPETAEGGAQQLELRGRSLRSLEDAAIRAAFERHAGNRRAMVAELGIAKSSLLRKLDLLGLR